MARARISSLIFLAAATLLGSSCGGPTITELTAKYFNLVDASTFSYATETGLAEVHDYARDTDEEERQIYNRTARRGGFLQDDATVTLEATEDRNLQITRYYDCLTRCGTLSDPIVMFDAWPLEPGARNESTTLISLTENGEPAGERAETHLFVVGEEEAVTTAAGTFESAFTVVWTRTIEGVATSATFVVAPDSGFVVFEDFSGQRFELTDGPVLEDEADGAAAVDDAT